MTNTVNQYPPSTTVTKKDCSTIVLEKHSIIVARRVVLIIKISQSVRLYSAPQLTTSCTYISNRLTALLIGYGMRCKRAFCHVCVLPAWWTLYRSLYNTTAVQYVSLVGFPAFYPFSGGVCVYLHSLHMISTV